MVESGRISGIGRIRTSIEKLSPRVPEKGRILCEYRKMVESGQLPVNGRIRASIEKLFRWVLEKGPINVSTEEWKNPGKYHEKV